MFDFPATPTVGTTYVSAGVTYTYTGTTWDITGSSASGAEIGDVKSGFQAADHNGWIKLDGRAVSTLTATQQAAAATLGFAANLPNAALCSLRQDDAAAPGVVGGSAKIAVTNLPAHNMTSAGFDAPAVTSSSAGGHKHTIQLNDNGIANSVGDKNIYSLVVSGGAVKWSSRMLCAEDNGTAYSGTGNFMDTAGAHTHTVDLPSHTHTVALGGSGTDYYAKALVVNFFTFLGA